MARRCASTAGRGRGSSEGARFIISRLFWVHALSGLLFGSNLNNNLDRHRGPRGCFQAHAGGRARCRPAGVVANNRNGRLWTEASELVGKLWSLSLLSSLPPLAISTVACTALDNGRRPSPPCPCHLPATGTRPGLRRASVRRAPPASPLARRTRTREMQCSLALAPTSVPPWRRRRRSRCGWCSRQSWRLRRRRSARGGGLPPVAPEPRGREAGHSRHMPRRDLRRALQG